MRAFVLFQLLRGERLQPIAKLAFGARLELPGTFSGYPEPAADLGQGQLFLGVGQHAHLHNVSLPRIQILHGLGKLFAEQRTFFRPRETFFLVLVVGHEIAQDLA
jgi:hypothetical protein